MPLQIVTGAAMNPALPFVAQQTHILNTITAGGAEEAEAARGDRLFIDGGRSTGMTKVPVTEELQDLEDRIADHLAQLNPLDSPRRMALFGPGMSTTDPLYALRFLAKLALKTERPGELTVYDFNSDPLRQRYYEEIPWGGHEVRLALGREANFTSLKQAGSHLILSIHPGVEAPTLFNSFSENLLRGGIGLVQSSVLQEFSEEEDYRQYLDLLTKMSRNTLEFFEPPLRKPLFRSFFSERSSDVHIMVVRRK